MKTTVQKKRFAGFTLVELLVVIMIVITLATVTTIATRSALRTADETKARKVCTDMLMAIENFRMDHNNLYPITDYPEGDKDWEARTDESNDMMRILTNREKSMDKINQTGKTYFSTTEKADRMDGLYVKGDEIGLYDPWGQAYVVALDTNSDEKTKDPTDPAAPEVYKKVIVVSLGADRMGGTPEKNADNISTLKGSQK